jgi:hypothetical protein
VLPPPETIHVRDASGDLEICVGDGDVALLVEGQPCALVWPASNEQLEHFYVRAYDTSAIADRLRDLRAFVDGIDLHQPLRAQIGPLLHCLVDGRYTVELLRPLGLEHEAPVPGQQRPKRGVGRWMDWAGLHRVSSNDPLLLGSVPHELLDVRRVEELEDRIGAGARPIIVLLTLVEPDVTFLVAGHEVMEAYQRCGVSPCALLITYETPRWLSVDDGIRLLGQAYQRCSDLASAHFRSVRGVRSVDGVGG